MPTALESAIVMAVITLVSAVAMVRDRSPAGRGGRGRAAWAWVAWLGVGDAFNILLFFAAYKITITVSVLSHYLTPVFVAAVAPFALRERMTSRTAAAIALAFGGLVAIFAQGGGGGAPTDAVWRSAALGAGSAVFYASNVIVNKFVARSFTTSETMFWHGVVATPLLAAFVPPDAWAAADGRAVAFLALVSIGPGGLAGLAFVWGLRRMPAAHASTLTLLEPLLSVALGIAVMGEASSAQTLLGGGAILAGAFVLATSRVEAM
jgi:drug/metabolite transporter (DMT)-like permease